MTYKEDFNLPEWVQDPLCNPDEATFNRWYENTWGCGANPRSARYYQMRRAWMASKEHYTNKQDKVKE